MSNRRYVFIAALTLSFASASIVPAAQSAEATTTRYVATLEVKNGNVVEVFNHLFRQRGVNYLIRDGVQGRLTCSFYEFDWDLVIQYLAAAVRAHVRQDARGVYIVEPLHANGRTGRGEGFPSPPAPAITAPPMPPPAAAAPMPSGMVPSPPAGDSSTSAPPTELTAPKTAARPSGPSERTVIIPSRGYTTPSYTPINGGFLSVTQSLPWYRSSTTFSQFGNLFPSGYLSPFGFCSPAGYALQFFTGLTPGLTYFP